MSVTNVNNEKPLTQDEWVAVINGMIAKLKQWLRKVQLSSLVRGDKLVVPMGGKTEYAARITDLTIISPTSVAWMMTRSIFMKLNIIVGMCDRKRGGTRYVWGINRDGCWFLMTIKSTHLIGQGNTATRIDIDFTSAEKLIKDGHCTPQTLIKGILDFCKSTEEHMAERQTNFATCANDIKELSDKCIQDYPDSENKIREQRCSVRTDNIEPGRLLENIALGKIRIAFHNIQGLKKDEKVSLLDVWLRDDEMFCTECATIYKNFCPVCADKRNNQTKD